MINLKVENNELVPSRRKHFNPRRNMKLLYVSLLVLSACRLGRCDLEPSTHQVFATGGASAGSGDSPEETPDPLSQAWWNRQLKRADPKAFPKTQVNGYFKKYGGIDWNTVPTASQPITYIDQDISNLAKTGTQICLYRCMKVTEARDIGINLQNYGHLKPCQLAMEDLKGHLGHLTQASKYCRPGQTGPPKVLIEFLLLPNAHNLLFTPRVAAIGTESKSTAVIAEMALVKKEGKYVVKGNAEGFVSGFIGIKSEEDYFSLAMQGNQVRIADNPTKRLLSKLTQYVKAIEPGTEATCSKVLTTESPNKLSTTESPMKVPTT